MTTFTERWRQLNWDDIRLRIHSKTSADVERALHSPHITREDLMALLSPAASDFLEPMAQQAQKLTRQRFGNTVSFYVPLYLSNLCANDCTYCGFSMSNHLKRKTLDENEIARECAALRELGFEHLLLVTGEHQGKVGMDYFRRHFPSIRRQFASLQMEVQPLAQGRVCRAENPRSGWRHGLSGDLPPKHVRETSSAGVKSRIFSGGWKHRID